MITTIILSIAISVWCPVDQHHDHKKQFRIGQWLKKNNMYQRARICKKKECKNYMAKQWQYKH